ncbi:hypothetical protein CG91_gp062 [Mycobacterium phage 39HC]|uniref:hypothetical protein n=1 Tax=Mycobacterium phage 39HC TaxID=1463809 RepID=UPI0003F21678|nr:hypothetical protein CG91_gp062 [Mycobacterium phage 39HC]AHJ88362.1 hypothetical protein 39HC_062 [Mycobacterium phage 39HC]AHJ88462.1 hypothetical protein 40BC_062 [Mycobacterium phage 40BC]
MALGDPEPLTARQVAEALLALPDPDATLELWCGGDYGQFSVTKVESPVTLNPANPASRRVVAPEAEGAVVVRLV